jgi:hypothetical protein
MLDHHDNSDAITDFIGQHVERVVFTGLVR